MLDDWEDCMRIASFFSDVITGVAFGFGFMIGLTLFGVVHFVVGLVL